MSGLLESTASERLNDERFFGKEGGGWKWPNISAGLCIGGEMLLEFLFFCSLDALLIELRDMLEELELADDLEVELELEADDSLDLLR